MTGQEIATAFHHSVRADHHGVQQPDVRHHPDAPGEGLPGRVSGTALTNPDFARFIESFGGHGEVVERTDDLVPAFERARASGKPALIEVRTDPEQITNRSTIAQLREQARRAAEGAATESAGAAHSAASRAPEPRRTGPRPR